MVFRGTEFKFSKKTGFASFAAHKKLVLIFFQLEAIIICICYYYYISILQTIVSKQKLLPQNIFLTSKYVVLSPLSLIPLEPCTELDQGEMEIKMKRFS